MPIMQRLTMSGRRLAVVAIATLLLVAVGSPPAGADPGITRITRVDEFTYEDVHPCTGEPRTVDAVYNVTIQEHANLTSLRIKMSSVASDGTIERGTQIITDHVRRGVFRVQMNTNNVDAEGNRFVGHLRLVVDESGVQEDRFYTCTGRSA